MTTQKQTKIKAAARIKATDLPKFRYVDDFLRYAEDLDSELTELDQLVTKQQKLLAQAIGPVKANFEFEVAPSDPGAQRKSMRILKTRIDPEIKNVQVPNIQKLQRQYNIAEDLYEKHKAIESAQTQLSLQFSTGRGSAFNKANEALDAMKLKTEGLLKKVLGFLGEVANKHVPKAFVKYVQALASLVEDHTIYKEAHSFMYASVDAEGFLLFTNYLMLVDAINDKGEIAPHLYISIQWHISEQPSVRIDLNHEYQVPNQLIGHGEAVGSVGEAARALGDMLDMENFSSALGAVPLALQLKVQPEKITTNMFAYRDVIENVSIDENKISFDLRPEVGTGKFADQVSYQIYKELRALLKSKNCRLTMKRDNIGKKQILIFSIVKIAESGEFSDYDLEFLRDKFNLDSSKLKKIARIINGE